MCHYQVNLLNSKLQSERGAKSLSSLIKKIELDR